nr:hypothetical protein BaRGS_002278 [Batillaria attramentaria]
MAGESKKSSGGQGQGHHSGGQGHHGHDHHDRRQDRKAPRQRPTSSTKRGSSDDARSHGDTDAQETEVTQSQSAVSVEDGDVTLLSGDEKVFITRDEEGWGDMNVNKGDDHPAGGTQNGQELASPPLTPPLPSKLSKDNYDIRSFNSSLNEFVGVLKDKRYQEVNDDYPVDDLLSVVSMVSATIEEYKEHSSTHRNNWNNSATP